MEEYRRVKVIGKGAFGAAVLVRNGNSLFVMKARKRTQRDFDFFYYDYYCGRISLRLH
jgi:glycerol-3-phosphate dehydrogenase